MVHIYGGELGGDGSDHDDSAYFEIDSDEDDPDSPMLRIGLSSGLPSEPTQPCQFDAAGYLDFTKRVDAVDQAHS